MKIKSIKCTGSCCPSQWEGTTEDNESFYIRYRWGRLTIQLSEPDGTVSDAINNGKLLYSKQLGNGWDGVMSLGAVLEIIKTEMISLSPEGEEKMNENTKE